MSFEDFKKLMLRAKRGQRICYYTGNLVNDRKLDEDLDLIARFVTALYEIDTARLYHAGNQYFVCLTSRLKARRDKQGSFDEAERMMAIC